MKGKFLMKISDKDIERIAEMAKIELREEEKKKVKEELTKITELFKDIEELEFTESVNDFQFGDLRSDDNVNGVNERGTSISVPRIVG